jgi:ADP-ribosylglycohydrolase
VSSLDRAQGCLIALAAGDALGAPTEGMTQTEIAERFGRVEDFQDADSAGTDDTEYAVLTAIAATRHGHALTSADVAAVWREALTRQDGGFAGAGFSEMIALGGLRSGLAPPATGIRNPERWSDGAAMRVAPLGLLCAGDPTEAARLAAEDARVSHSGDGVWAAQAVAAAVAVAAGGGGWREALDAGAAALPPDSWTARTVGRALGIVAETPDAVAAEVRLYREISLFHYPWADAAPEALALAFGVIAAHEGDVLGAIFAGVNMGRDSDTIAAMAGAVCGALVGIDGLPAAWPERVRHVSGRCISATRGQDLLRIAEGLVARAEAVA